MSDDGPGARPRRSRPSAAFRRLALDLTPVGGDERPEHRQDQEDLRAALRQIPDADGRGLTGDAGRSVSSRALGDDLYDDPDVFFRPEPAVLAPSGEVAAISIQEGTVRSAAPPWWRRVAFIVALVALVAAIPVLALAGYEAITDSTDGRFGGPSAGPSDPGYEELVSSTPTALVVHRDSDGTPISLALLALSDESGGGSVVFVPLDTEISNPGFGIERIGDAYDVTDDPARGIEMVAGQSAQVLNVGIDEVFELDDRGWSQVMAPVAPLSVTNPEPLDLGPRVLEAGPVDLPADLIGPYLGALREGEDEVSRAFRQELLWRSWLSAVNASDRPDVLPGETSSGIGLFVRTLAAGEVTYSTLPGETDATTGAYLPEADAVADLVVDAVPIPDPASPGSRARIRLLNGVAPEAIPVAVTRQIVGASGTVAIIGNASSFGRDETTMVYADPEQEAYAATLMAELGGTGRARLDLEADEDVDLTVVLGRDVLDGVSDMAESPSNGRSGGGAVTSSTSSPSSSSTSSSSSSSSSLGEGP
ncbi:hypothetical protein BH23ACT2_BH23ACT2_26190 [soil metagenome]